MVKRNLMVVGLALLLSACGFQLRGTGDAEFALTEIDLQARDSHGQTVQQLKDLLESNDVHVHPGARYSLNLANEQTRQRTASYTSSARSAEYELTTTRLRVPRAAEHAAAAGSCRSAARLRA